MTCSGDSSDLPTCKISVKWSNKRDMILIKLYKSIFHQQDTILSDLNEGDSSKLNNWSQIKYMQLIWKGELITTLCDKVCQWLATGQWFSQGTPVSSTNKTDRHDILEILLKVALNIINPHKPCNWLNLKTI